MLNCTYDRPRRSPFFLKNSPNAPESFNWHSFDAGPTYRTYCLAVEFQGIAKFSANTPRRIFYNKMEVFIQSKIVLRSCGCTDSNKPSDRLWDYIKRAITSACILFLLLPSLWYTVFNAGSFAERAEAVLAVVCGAENFFIYSILLLQRKTILNILRQLQAKVQQRKYNLSGLFVIFPGDLSCRPSLRSLFSHFSLYQATLYRPLRFTETETVTWKSSSTRPDGACRTFHCL